MGRNEYMEEIATKIGEDPLERRQIEEMLDGAFCREGGSFEERPDIEEKAARRFGVMSFVVVITLLALFCFSVRNSHLVRHGFELFQEYTDLSFDEEVARKIMTLDADAELLCYGDPEASPENRMKALWESQPEVGAYYFEHLKTYEREKGELPDGWQEQSEKVFPKNGVAYLLQASSFNKNILSKKLSKEGREPLSVATLSDGDSWRDYVVAFELNDDEAYQHWVESIDKAMSYPELDFYSRQLMDERYLAFDEPATLIEFSSRVVYVFSGFFDFSMSQRRNANLLAYRVGQYAASGDVARVRKLEEQWLRLIEANSQGGLLVNHLVSMAMASTALNFAEAEMVLGEKERSRIFLDLAIWQQKQRESRLDRSSRPDDLVDAGILDILATTGVGRYAPEIAIKDQDIKAGRMVERAVAGQIFHWSVTVVLLFSLFMIWLYSTLGSRRKRKMSRCLLGVLDWKDYCWLALAGGCVAPLVYYLANEPAGIGLSSMGFDRSEGMQPIVQVLSLGVLALSVPVSVGWWRLKRHYPELLTKGRKFENYLVLGAVMAPFVLWGLRDFNPTILNVIAFSMCAVSVFCLVWKLFRAVFGDRMYALKNQMMGRILIFCYAVGGLVLLACCEIERGRESKWIAQWDTFNLVAVDGRELGFESRVSLFLEGKLEAKLNELKSKLE